MGSTTFYKGVIKEIGSMYTMIHWDLEMKTLIGFIAKVQSWTAIFEFEFYS